MLLVDKINKKANLSLETVIVCIIIIIVLVIVIYFVVTYFPNLFDVFKQQGANAASIAKP